MSRRSKKFNNLLLQGRHDIQEISKEEILLDYIEAENTPEYFDRQSGIAKKASDSDAEESNLEKNEEPNSKEDEVMMSTSTNTMTLLDMMNPSNCPTGITTREEKNTSRLGTKGLDIKYDLRPNESEDF